jgi:competence protein ComEC
MAFPLLPIVLALIAGLLSQIAFKLPLLLSLLFFFAAFLAAWFFYWRRRHTLSFVIALAGFFFFGASYYYLQHQAFEANPLRALATEDYLDLEGKVKKTPALTSDRFQLLLETEKVSFEGKERPIKGLVQVSFPLSSGLPRPEVLAGDKVRVSARLLRDDDFSNFSPSVSLIVMKSRGIHRRAYAKSLRLLQPLGPPDKFSLLRPISSLHRAWQKKIEHHFPAENSLSPEGAFLEALLLGERGRLAEATVQTLQQSGLFHLIAISGAHIAIISFFLFHLLRLCRLPVPLRSIFIIAALIFYALLVEGRPSVIRATTMTIIYLLGKLLWKDTHLLNTLSAAALFLLLVNPLQLVEAGFILTFMATLTIIIFFPRLKQHLPILPWRLTDLLILSVAAQLGVLPFIAYSFNRITLSSLILNLAAVPLIGLTMAMGWLFLMASLLSSTIGNFLALLIKGLVRLFFFWSQLLEGFKPLSYRIPPPPIWVIAGYFLFLFLLISRRRFRWQKMLLGSGFALFLFLLLLHPFPSTTKYLRLTLLDVGQGESILVEFPGKEKMLVDGGGLEGDSFDVGEYVVSPFLWRCGLKKIDYLVLTHGHPDHLNGLRAVVSNFKIKEFWEAVTPEGNKTYEEIGAKLPSTTRRRRLFRGERLTVAGLSLEVLHPPAPTKNPAPVSNEDSLVFRLRGEKGLVLFTADIGEKSEQELVNLGFELLAAVLKSPHHGSRTSSSEVFLEAVKPEIILISAGRGNIYGVPHPEILERYQKLGVKIYRTDRDGAIELTFKSSQILIRTSRSHLREVVNL